MRLFRNTRALVLLGLLVLILIVVIPLIVFLILAEQKQHMPGRLTPTPRTSQIPGGAQSWPVISRNVSVFASSATEPDSDANDDDYDDIHPTQMRFGAYRQQWANKMLAAVYGIHNIKEHSRNTLALA